jgi:transposase
MKIYVGIDLHSTNCYFAVMNENGSRLFHKRVVNEKEAILEVLKRIKTYGDISDMVVESTYNWYWLVDLLEDNNYPVQLTNPVPIFCYNESVPIFYYLIKTLAKNNCVTRTC